nr:integrase, catalytic region, zinc finger, CCHC-type, peptidase aspartic, catalytic [Tanacetum cinerariifolium]
MTENIKLCNFVAKYLGTVRFDNDQFAPILGYRHLVQGNVTIKRIYYIECLNHNLFFVGQFCDVDMEVAFRKSTRFIRDLWGNDLLMGTRGSDLYTIALQDSSSPTLIFIDGENLVKMKEKGDPCIFMEYSIASKGYRVYNKRTRLIVESIHLKFDKIKEMTSVDNNTSGLAPQRQNPSSERTEMTFKHNSSSLENHDHNNEPSSSKLIPNVSPSADTNAPSLQELDFLFSPLFEEYFSAGNQKLKTPTTTVHAEENNTNQAADVQFVSYEFFNPLYA